MTTHTITGATFNSKYRSTDIILNCGHRTIVAGNLEIDDTWPNCPHCIDDNAFSQLLPKFQARCLRLVCGCREYSLA